jgi:hypothetical protein
VPRPGGDDPPGRRIAFDAAATKKLHLDDQPCLGDRASLTRPF